MPMAACVQSCGVQAPSPAEPGDLYLQGSSVKDEAFVPGTPEPSTELRRQPSPPPAADVPSILQTSSKPGSGPKPPEQAAAKPWHAWVHPKPAASAACTEVATLRCRAPGTIMACVQAQSSFLQMHMAARQGCIGPAQLSENVMPSPLQELTTNMGAVQCCMAGGSLQQAPSAPRQCEPALQQLSGPRGRHRHCHPAAAQLHGVGLWALAPIPWLEVCLPG